MSRVFALSSSIIGIVLVTVSEIYNLSLIVHMFGLLLIVAGVLLAFFKVR